MGTGIVVALRKALKIERKPPEATPMHQAPAPAPASAPQAVPPPSMVLVQSLEEFRPMLDHIETSATDDADLRRRLANLQLAPRENVLASIDPFSGEYRAAVLQQFKLLTGSAHSVSSEGLTIDVAHEAKLGFPYATQSPEIIGGFLMAFGHLIALMNLPPGAQVIEMGAGTGALTRQLMLSGYRVTACEINASNCELVRTIGANAPHPPVVVQEEFDSFQQAPGSADAVIFFESFHHALNHAELLDKAKTWLKPGGIIVFAAEPVVADHVAPWPYPWGLRVDGESLRAISRWGWLELGFRETYFFELLKRAGFTWTRQRLPLSHWSDVIIARLA